MATPPQPYKLSRLRFVKAYWVAFKVIQRYLALLVLSRIISEERAASLFDRAHDTTARQIVTTLLELKGLYIKIGQTLSVLGNFLPERFTEGLASLQDAVPPHPFEEIEERFHRDFGRTAGELFQSIERTPIAAASLGQVHVAYDRSGQKLAVKLQYPGIEEITRGDLKTIRNIFGLVHFFFPGYNLKSVIEEASRIIMKELDYVLEADNIAKIAATCQDDKTIVFPQVIRGLSSSKVLTTSFIEGIKVTDVKRLTQAGINPHDLAVRLIHFYCRQIFASGIYHADPHPGNIIIGKNGEICMVDFGAVATVSPEMRKGLTLFVEGIIKRDARVMTQAIKIMGFVAKHNDSETLDKVVDYFYSKISAIKIQSFKNLDITQFQRLSDLIELKKMNISFRELTTLFVIPREWILLERAMLLIMGLTAQLDETLNPVEIVVPYAEKFLLGEDKKLTDLLLSASKDLLLSYLNLPSTLDKTLRKINAGQVELSIKGLNRELATIRHAFSMFAAALFSCTFGGLSYLMYQAGRDAQALRFEMGFYAFATLFVFMLIRK